MRDIELHEFADGDEEAMGPEQARATFMQLTCGCIGRVLCCRWHGRHKTILDCIEEPQKILYLYLGTSYGGAVCSRHRLEEGEWKGWRSFRWDHTEQYQLPVNRRNVPHLKLLEGVS